jgi:uncharacterized protein (DUF1330 family)
MKAYVVAQTEVFDRKGYQLYADGFWDIFDRHRGRFLASSLSNTLVAEGVWDPPKTVIMVFPNRAAAEGWLNDPDYVALAEIRKRTARTNMVIVDTLGDTWVNARRATWETIGASRSWRKR